MKDQEVSNESKPLIEKQPGSGDVPSKKSAAQAVQSCFSSCGACLYKLCCDKSYYNDLSEDDRFIHDIATKFP